MTNYALFPLVFYRVLCIMDVLHLLKTAAGGIAQGTGDVSLAVARGSLEDNVVAFVNVLAGGKPQYLCFVQFAVLVVFNALHSGRRYGEARVADKPVQFVALASVPFRIHQQAQPLLEAQFIERGIFQLVGNSAAIAVSFIAVSISIVAWFSISGHLPSGSRPRRG